MRRIFAGAFFSAALLFFISSIHHAQAGIVYYDELFGYTKTTVQYGTGIANNGKVIPLLADVYQPVDIGLAPVPENRPAIVIQDGGSWVSANRTAGRVTYPAIYSAQRGYTVVVTDYRQGAQPFIGLGPAGPHHPVTVGQTQFGTAPYAGITTGFIYSAYPGINAIRAGIEDFALGIDWTRTNAAALGINPNKIAIAGGSAGGIDALLLQYNNNSFDNNGLTTVDPRWAAQAVIALVSTMDGNHGKIQAGGPPVFLLNNTADFLVPWSPGMSQRFVDVGIYREQWYQPTDALYHNVEWDKPISSVAAPIGSFVPEGLLVEKMRDFLYKTMIVPEPSSFVMGAFALAALAAIPVRQRISARGKKAA